MGTRSLPLKLFLLNQIRAEFILCILISIFLIAEQAKCHLSVGYAVHTLKVLERTI